MGGIFVTFEGAEGSGKSTQAKLLYDYLKGWGHSCILIREPGSTAIGEKIRAILLDKDNSAMDYFTEMYLYAAARAQLMGEIVRPALEEGKIVICDRFVDSSCAYQAKARGLGYDVVLDVNKYAINGRMPDLTFFLDVSPEEGMKRRKATEKFDRLDMENMAFHQEVYSAYKELSKINPDRFVTVSGIDSPEEILNNLVINFYNKFPLLKKEV